jgi:osmotically-inducible protein OsmY
VRRALLLLATLAACRGYRDPGDSEELRVEIEDSNVATRVRIALGEDRDTAPWDGVRVSCREGVVTLEGAVGDQAVRRRVVEVAESCEGVRLVRDRLTVTRRG